MRKLCLSICCLMMLWAGMAAARPLIVSDLRAKKSQPGPLLVALHDTGSNHQAMKSQSRLDAAARQAGLVVLYPSAEQGRWQSSDVEYLARLIKGVLADPRVENRPVIVAGHGAGGDIALRLACARPDLVAGVGVVATKLARGFRCTRGRPKPAMFIHGTADPVSPHDGTAQQHSASETIALWSRINRCRDATRVTRRDTNTRDKTSVVFRSYTKCQATLTHATVLGGGHGWFTGRAGRGGKLGPMSAEINASDTLVQFLRPLVGR